MFDEFDWDETKRTTNFEKHEIDFEDAIEIFKRSVVVVPEREGGGGEVRYVAIGLLDDVEIAVIYTRRSNVCRVISARRARKNERRAHREAFPEEYAQGQD